MRYGILGPLQVASVTGDGAVGAGRDRVVLATLLLHAGRAVSLDRLVESLWDQDPPATARGQVHSAVSRLRRLLASVGAADALVTTAAGYLIQLAGDDDLDAAVFDRLVTQARAAADAGALHDARRLFREALALWRGPVLADVQSRAVRRDATALTERRSTALEDCLEVELRLGLERDLIGELTGLVQQHPLRERLRAQLMLALYRAGRQAEALVAYRQARDVFTEELGIEPGPELQELHRRILGADAALAPERPPGDDRPPPVHCLPRPVTDFTGRAESVDGLLAAASVAGQAPVIQLIDGMAGSGKTALAVHVAHLLAREHPDAQLFIDLYGHGERQPLEPAAALVTLLRQLGVPSERIPPELEQRQALWRTELARRRAVVVLDNAASTAQVAPLLPAAAGTIALVTSRRRLLGLDGVRPRSLPVLAAAEALELLGRVVGAGRVAAEPEAAAEVARRCGYLPLALRLAGARLVHRPGWTVAHLAERLSDDRPLLPELAAEDRTVAGAFGLSYEPLAPPHRRMFRLLGLFPGGWVEEAGAAALADVSVATARDLLADLVDRHLVEEPTAGRFRLHDLMREYAASLAAADPAGEAAALERLFNYYVHAAAVAAATLETPSSRRDIVLDPSRRPELLSDPARLGAAWLDVQRPNLTPMVHAAVDRGLYRHAWQLARVSGRFFFTRGYRDDLLATHYRALEASPTLGDGPAASLYNYVAAAHFRAGAYQEALQAVQAAVELRRKSGDPVTLMSARTNLGLVYALLGDLEQAARIYEENLAAARARGPLSSINFALHAMATLMWLKGRYPEALHYHRRHLILSCELGSPRDISLALGNIGQVRLKLGHLGPAGRLLRAALPIKRRVGNHYGVAETLNDLAVLLRLEGDLGQSLRLHREALDGVRTVGDRHGECLVLIDFAATSLAAGDIKAAQDLYGEALEIAERGGYRMRRADAHDGMARCLAAEDPPAARRHWESALVLYREIGLPQQAAVEDHLRRLDAGGRMDP
ncbi:MAG TPA: BTAD domain-containing putative transcriptional regulator [Pilimelia sp.]|nr:BTAD domain-containing putative transcriptional regulator [Pilimelia sp.]